MEAPEEESGWELGPVGVPPLNVSERVASALDKNIEDTIWVSEADVRKRLELMEGSPIDQEPPVEVTKLELAGAEVLNSNDEFVKAGAEEI